MEQTGMRDSGETVILKIGIGHIYRDKKRGIRTQKRQLSWRQDMNTHILGAPELVITEAYSGIQAQVLLMLKKPIQNPKSFPHFSRAYNATDFHFYVRLQNICDLLSELLRTTVFWYHSILLELMWTPIQYSKYSCHSLTTEQHYH